MRSRYIELLPGWLWAIVTLIAMVAMAAGGVMVVAGFVLSVFGGNGVLLADMAIGVGLFVGGLVVGNLSYFAMVARWMGG